MKKEITIEDDKNVINIHIPDGYEVDQKNSTISCIKLKKSIPFRNNTYERINGYAFNPITGVIEQFTDLHNTKHNFNVFASEKELNSAIAMARISQILENDKRFGGAITESEWKDDRVAKYTFIRRADYYTTDSVNKTYSFLAFHTPEQRKLFEDENKDLIKDYFMI